MNWITKIIKAGEKIKTAIHKRATNDEIANSDWTSCCKGPILKKDLEYVQSNGSSFGIGVLKIS